MHELTKEGLETKKLKTYREIGEHYNRKKWIKKDEWPNTRKKVLRKARIAGKGSFVDPHTGEKSRSKKNWEADHTVAMKEAHESGGNKFSIAQKRQFGHDIKGLELIKKATNRAKREHDLSNWLGKQGKVDYANRTETIKNKYGLSMDKQEASVFQNITGRKTSTKIAPKLKNTPYCTRCHIKHSVGNH